MSKETTTKTISKTEYKLPPILMSKGELTVIDATSEEKEAIMKAIQEINIEDTQSIISYGVSVQRQLTTVSEQMLEGVRNKETGPAGDALNSMVATLRGFDVRDLAGNKKPGFIARLFGALNPLAKAIQKYEKVKHQIDAVESELESHVTKLMRDIVSIDRLYDTSLEYFHSLAVYIAAGDEKLKELDDIIIPKLKAQAEASNDVMDAQKLNDLNNARNILERKIHDLKLTRQVTMQSLPSLRIVQDNDNNLVTKIQSSIVNTVPLWKTQMAQALTVQRSVEASKALKAAHDLTNELLETNAEHLKQANRQIRTEVERGMFDIASIEKANNNLIDTINESLAIYEQGKVQRADAEKRLVECESTLKERLKNFNPEQANLK